jgi:hypothetical protein
LDLSLFLNVISRKNIKKILAIGLLFFDPQTLLQIFSDKFFLIILEKNLEIPKYLIFASQNQPIKTV